MKNKAIDILYPCVLAVLAGALGCCILFGSGILGEALAYLTRKTAIPFLTHVSLGVGLIASAILLSIRSTRSVGFLILGACLLTLGVAARLMNAEWPTGFSYNGDGITHTVAWLYWLTVIAAFVAAIFGILHDKAAYQFRQTQAERISDLEASNTVLTTKAEEALSSEASAKGSVQALKDQHAEKLKSLERKIESERSAHLQTRASRPYESQLVAAFCISLAVRWQYLHKDTQLSLNHFQGNKDKDFGDFVGLTKGVCWLIEIKRNWSSVSTEKGKPIRVRQKRALSQQPSMRALAEKCHWMAWGAGSEVEASILFAPYWVTMDSSSAPVSFFDQETFVSRALPEPFCSHSQRSASAAVGISPDQFALYVDFLAMNTGGAVYEDPDLIAALVFEARGDGSVRYWIEPDLHAYAISISKAIERTKEDDTPHFRHGIGQSR